ncbi:MAG: Gfo/Idh/MocA family oxidoreductase [Acidobacteriota bacterium]|nr:Gfo/Idh/MocA family oxidoreductase [Acidobacteriota bacterium]
MSETQRIRWGIFGTGLIAHKFAEALALLPRAELVAVASRSAERAEEFGERFGIPVRHGSYEELARDERIDIAYVGTATPHHEECAVRSLRAGKAVLCEKPLAVNAEQALRMVAAAREEGRLLMEALWSRFVPAFRQAREWLKEGAIGEVQMVQADFGFRAEGEDLQRWLSPEAAGGSLMFVGVYPVSLAVLAFGGAPTEVKVVADLGPNGTDRRAGMLLGFAGGGVAVLASAVDTKTPRFGTILGSQGMIRLDEPFYCSPGATLALPGQDEVRVSIPVEGNGLHYQAAAMMETLDRGEVENGIMPHEESIAVLRVMDELRRQLGMRFPCESKERETDRSKGDGAR